jgi:cell division protein FtsQ
MRLELGRFAPSSRSIVVGLGLLAAAVGAYAVARETSLFAIQRVKLVGAPPSVAAQVRQAVRDLRGTSLVALDGGELLRRVSGVPTVASARYDRAFPHTLTMFVRPEQPVAVLRAGRRAWLVSARGRVVQGLARRARAELPRIWVPSATQVELGSILSESQGGTAAQSLRPLARGGFPARIQTVSLAHRELVFTLASGVQIRLGRPSDLRLKVAIARRIVTRLPSGAMYIDVSVPERPVAGIDPQVSG